MIGLENGVSDFLYVAYGSFGNMSHWSQNVEIFLKIQTNFI